MFRFFLFGEKIRICQSAHRRKPKARGAQITQRSRVGKLAFQRGEQSCSASVATPSQQSTKCHRKAVLLAGSKVQIRYFLLLQAVKAHAGSFHRYRENPQNAFYSFRGTPQRSPSLSEGGITPSQHRKTQTSNPSTTPQF